MPTNNAINNSSKLTQYTSSTTWTKDSRTVFVEVWGWDAGGNGSSGRKGASTAAGGGGGGGGGGGWFFTGPSAVFGATETETVGAATLGAVAQAANLTNGVSGSAANLSKFGNIQNLAQPASMGGTTTSADPGTSNSPLVYYTKNTGAAGGSPGGYGINTDGDTVSPIGGQSNFFMLGTGGGGGAGYDVTAFRTGGNGGLVHAIDEIVILNAGGAGGVETGTINGGNGNIPLTSGGMIMGGTGGGGGGGPKAATVAGIGGNGAAPGGGGGGGGGGVTLVANSGAGGNGARGEIWVLEHF